MKIPERYLQLDLSQQPFNLKSDGDGQLLEWPKTYAFLPHGYLDTQMFAVGNGDSCGLYWPIGKENSEPLLCDIYHDNSALIPQASSLEGLAKLKHYLGEADDEQLAEYLALKLGFDLPEPHDDEDQDLNQLLRLDPQSPLNIVSVGIVAFQHHDLQSAEDYFLQALSLLPEYTRASYYLADLYRQQLLRQLDAAKAMIAALTSPIVFLNAYRRTEVLKWLQEDKPEFTELQSDPIWLSRKKITCEMYVKYNDDFIIYEEAVQEYLRQGKGIEAVRLRELIGELMQLETSAFRERYDYSIEKHTELLIDNLQRAGLESRIPAVRA